MFHDVIALTRPVSPKITQCELTHVGRVPIDAQTATRQHRQFEQVLAGLGCEIVHLPELPKHPDGVFVEDTAVVLEPLAILARPGALSRRDETLSVAHALSEHRELHYLQEPDTLDGGDVIVAGKTLYVGLSTRTSPGAHKQLAVMLRPFGYKVEPVEFEGCLHLKAAATLVADNVMLVNPAFVDPARFVGFEAITVDPEEPDAANALRVNDVVVYPLQHRMTRQRLEQHGLNVQAVDISELAKAEAGVTCCCILISLSSLARRVG